MRPFPVDFDKQMPEWVERLGIESKERNGETLDYLIFQCKRCPDGHRNSCMHVPIKAGETLNSKVLKDRVQRYVCNDHFKHELRKQIHAAPLPEQPDTTGPPAPDKTGPRAPAPAHDGPPAPAPTEPPARAPIGPPAPAPIGHLPEQPLAPAPAPAGPPAPDPTGPPAPAPCEMCKILQQHLDKMRHDYQLLKMRFADLLGQDEEIERRLKALENIPATMPPPHAAVVTHATAFVAASTASGEEDEEEKEAALKTGSKASSWREIREQSSLQKQIVERMKEQAEEAECQGAEARRQASLEVGNAKQALLEKAANMQAAAESFRRTQLREERKLEAMAAAAVPPLPECEAAATGSVARDGAAGTSTAPAPARPSAEPVAVDGKRRAVTRDGAAGTSTAPAPARPSADPPAVDGKRKRREPLYDVPPIVGKHCSFCRQSDCAQGGSLHQCKAVNCMRLWSDRCIGRYAGDDDQKRCFHHAKCSHHELTNCPECVQNCMPALYEPREPLD